MTSSTCTPDMMTYAMSYRNPIYASVCFIAGYVLNSLGQYLLPANIESQLFLYANCNHWKIAEKSAILFNEGL